MPNVIPNIFVYQKVLKETYYAPTEWIDSHLAPLECVARLVKTGNLKVLAISTACSNIVAMF